MKLSNNWSGETISDLFLPVAGEVIEQNESLEENPELVNKDPYGEAMAYQDETCQSKRYWRPARCWSIIRQWLTIVNSG